MPCGAREPQGICLCRCCECDKQSGRMPSEIVILRHGQCTGNLAEKAEVSLYPQELRTQPSIEWPLTPLGIKEAVWAGAWMRANIAPRFDAYYCSDMVRAVQSGAHLGFDGAVWQHDPLLRERDWAGYERMHRVERAAAFEKAGVPVAEDSLEWSPPCGETSRALVERFAAFMATIHKRHRGERIVIMTHGGIIQAARVIQHRPSAEEYAAFVGGGNYIRNAQITRYFGDRRRCGDIYLYSREQTAFLRDGAWVVATKALA